MGKNQDPGYGINIPDPQHWTRKKGKKDEQVESEGYLGNNVQRFLVASSKLGEIVVRISCGFLHLIHPPTVTETDQTWRVKLNIKKRNTKILPLGFPKTLVEGN
jgi:hypothetical protein